MTNVKSLLALYLKMGGSLTDTYSDIAGGIPVGQYSLISDAVLACSKKYSSGGGGAEKFVVTLTQDAQTEEWTADKTVAEIVEADEAGKIVIAKATVMEAPLEMPLAVASESVLMFGSVAVADEANGITNVFGATSYSDGAADVWSVSAVTNTPELPSYSSSNNGQILGVSSGDLAWVDPNAPLIVTLTADEQTPGSFVGDKTYLEVYTAFAAGRSVRFIIAMDGVTSATNADLIVYDPNNGYEINAGNLDMSGAGTDYISFIAH